MTHILLVGNQNSPRSALLHKLLCACGSDRPLCGYQTVKEAPDAEGSAPIHLYPLTGERTPTQDNLVGLCKNQKATRFPAAFERSAHFIEDAPADALFVMDELGVMESDAPRFCKAVLRRLDGDGPVLAAVRDLDTPFLNAVRNHPKAKCFFLTSPADAEKVFPQALALLKSQN